MRSSSVELLLVGGVALLLRLTVFAVADRPGQLFVQPDSAEYDRLAWNLAESGVYSLQDSEPRIPDLTRTPVFPRFVAGCYCLAGHRPAFAVLVQVGCAVAIVLLLWVVGRCYFAARTGLAASGLQALDPLSNHYASLLLSETLFTLLFLGSLSCLLAYLRRPGKGWAIAAALLTGLAILCRPIAVFWPLALLPGFLLVACRGRSWRSLGHYGLLVAGVTTLVGPWILRNERAGGLAVLTTVPGFNLYFHRAAVLVAEQQGLDVDEARLLLANRLRQAVAREHLTPAQEYRLMERWGLEIIAAAPARYLGANIGGVVQMFLPEDPRDALPAVSRLGGYWFEAAFLTVVYSLGLTGLVGSLWKPGRLPVLLLGAVLTYFAVLSGPEAYARFRVPIMPAVALLAGAGLTVLGGYGTLKPLPRDTRRSVIVATPDH